MKTLLQFAFSWVTRIPWSTLRKLWSAIEHLVLTLEFCKIQGGSLSKAQKLDYVLERVEEQVPATHKEVGTQVVRAIVEISLINLRIRRNME